MLAPATSPDRLLAYRAYALIGLSYVVWRGVSLTAVSSVFQGVLSCVSFLAELLLLLAALRLTKLIVLAKATPRAPVADAEWWISAAPMIDILIPTYNEAEAIVERAIVGACNQHYPRFRVWILDDGDRPWLAALCARYGVGYCTRSSRAGAKAGNLNSALARLRALDEAPEFVAILDADYVAQPSFLSRVLTVMKDPDVALVQTPQAFYNLDAFQRAFQPAVRVPDSLRFTYDVVLPARDALDVANCIGTSFLVRMAALQQIGDFPTESVNEDLLLTARLRRANFRIRYLNEILSFGVATEGLSEYFVQRARWALGYSQLARRRWMTGHGFWKRLVSAEADLRVVYVPLAKTLFLSMPTVYFLTGVAPIQADSFVPLAFAAVLLGAHRGYLMRVSRGRHLLVYHDAVAVLGAMRGAWIAAGGLLDPTEREFQVTDKGVIRTQTRLHLGPLAWIVPNILIMAAGIAVGVGERVTFTGPRALLYVWTAASLAVLSTAALFCVERPQRRSEERFSAGAEVVEVELPHGRGRAELVDLSSTGARVRCAELGVAVGDSLSLWLGAKVGWVRALVVRRDQQQRLGLRFDTDSTNRAALIAKVYSSEYVKPVRAGSLCSLLAGVGFRLLAPFRSGARKALTQAG